MNPMWKAMAVASTLWGVLLVAAVMMIAPAGGHDWWDGGWRGEPAGALQHMRDDQHSGMSVGSEYDYLAEMVSHHQDAILAADELRRSDSADLRQLGEDIVASQRAQVRLMEGWLEDWYPDRPAYDPEYQPMMRDLTGLAGPALDQAYLADMIPHHMMAVMSSQHLLLRGDVEHPEVADLAIDIRDEQRREISLMRSWLSRYSAGRSLPGCPGR